MTSASGSGFSARQRVASRKERAPATGRRSKTEPLALAWRAISAETTVEL